MSVIPLVEYAQTDLQPLMVAEEQEEPVCQVCPEKATKRLQIDVGVMDQPDHLHFPVDVIIHHYCDKHAYPKVEYRLSPVGMD